MQNRNHSFHLWLNDIEYLELKKRSINSGLSVSDIIRLALQNQSVKSNPPREFYTSINKLNNIGNNINQIAKHANQTGEIYSNDLKIYLKQINKLIDDIYIKFL